MFYVPRTLRTVYTFLFPSILSEANSESLKRVSCTKQIKQSPLLLLLSIQFFSTYLLLVLPEHYSKVTLELVFNIILLS